MKTVNAQSVSGYNMSVSMFFGKSPLLTIVCGDCRHTFQSRTPCVDYATVICPACSSLNRLNLVYD